MAELKSIEVRGAREHNLKGIDVDIPRDQLVVITGLSGSGKSSLAFDTIYAEGQRRYVESLSAYARQFLDMMEKPDVDHISGLSPAISIEQKTTSKNPRSTVGTVTEIYDYLRLLFARVGPPYSPATGLPIEAQQVQDMVDRVITMEEGTRAYLLAPIVRDRKGEYRKELLEARRDGYSKARINGEVQEITDSIQLARYEKHDIELLIDRVKLTPNKRRRIEESIERSLLLAQGSVSVLIDGKYQLLSSKRTCPEHGHSAPELEPRLFSFNAPQGMCLECNGIGYLEGFNYSDMIDESKSVLTAFTPLNIDGRIPFSHLDLSIWKIILRKLKISQRTLWKNLSSEQKDQLWNGAAIQYSYVREREGSRKNITKKSWIGLKGICQQSWTYGRLNRLRIFRHRSICSGCDGQRLNPLARAVRFRDRNIQDFSSQTIEDLSYFVDSITLSPSEERIGEPIFRQLKHKINFLLRVGLGYLSLHRTANTLSGGESQRIRLAAQVGSGLQGVTYILDEPSIGLHHRDQARLLQTLEDLRNKGNTVIIVEHDPLTMSRADHFIELGPKAGLQGGELLASTSRGHFLRSKTITAEYLRGDKGLKVPVQRRISDKYLVLRGATGHNLKNITVEIPLHCLVVITGVSGSGKSTLIQETLCPILNKKLHQAQQEPLAYESIEGLENIEKLIMIDQQPIGRSPRSNPATYTDLMTLIRELFAATPAAKERGYTKSRFSFNVSNEKGGGRCEECSGGGSILVEMQFLNDVEVICEGCEGRRFNDETRDVLFKSKSIDEVLNLSVSEALEFFVNPPKIMKILTILLTNILN